MGTELPTGDTEASGDDGGMVVQEREAASCPGAAHVKSLCGAYFPTMHQQSTSGEA